MFEKAGFPAANRINLPGKKRLYLPGPYGCRLCFPLLLLAAVRALISLPVIDFVRLSKDTIPPCSLIVL